MLSIEISETFYTGLQYFTYICNYKKLKRTLIEVDNLIIHLTFSEIVGTFNNSTTNKQVNAYMYQNVHENNHMNYSLYLFCSIF